MSNYIINLKDRRTGEEIKICAFDDWFGRHKYGYQILGEVGSKVMNEDEFIQFKIHHVTTKHYEDTQRHSRL